MHCLVPAVFVSSVFRRLCCTIFVTFTLGGAFPVLADEGRLEFIQPLDLFSKCQNDCALTLLAGGSLSSNSISDLVGLGGGPRWNWDDVYIAGGAVSRTIAHYDPYFSIDLEVGAAKRFGNSHESEFWAASYFRWKHFPWNDTIYTTVGLSTGLNLATGISQTEREGRGGGTRLLHYFSPEITFAAPHRKDLELVFRLHHRSGVFGLFDGVHGGDHFGTVGLRFKF